MAVLAAVATLMGTCMAQDLQTELTKVCQESGMIGMSVVALCRGEVSDVFHYGLRDINRNLSVTNSTIYRVASISKHIGTMGLMQLYERGMFQLDDDVSQTLGFTLRNPYFPEVPITFRKVLSH